MIVKRSIIIYLVILTIWGTATFYWLVQFTTNRLSSSTVNIDPIEQACNPKNVLVLIKSGSTSRYQSRREDWRNSTCPSSYKQHGVNYHFMLGLPAYERINPQSHFQAKKPSEEELKDLLMLQDESTAHKDVIILPLKDVYEDIFIKTINIFRWGIER